MGSKGGSRAIKRYAAPSYWPTYKKEYKWVVKPSAGPHALADSLPLLVVLRDLMHVVDSSHEAKVVLNDNRIRVNGRVQRTIDFPIGVMDLISIPDSDTYVRILPFRGKLIAHQVSRGERDFRLLRVENKTCVPGLKIQLNLTGGVNVLLPLSNPYDAKNVKYSTMDTVKTNVQGTELLEHYRMQKGAYVLAVKGKNSGEHGTLKETVESFKRRKTLVRVEKANGESFETIIDYIYVVGDNAPIISLPEAA
ncbi:MAG: 30S ribosomal protein S4e [Candidatus Marsarchaeota archaeon]|nr:30S ribosomal protein S4e [Candidatus Marsarchaeota archaeon]